MTFEKGSLVLIDYTAKTKDGNEVYETTLKPVAHEHSIYHDDHRYRPKLVSIGDSSFPILTGLEESLAGMSVGDNRTVEVEPGKAFGERRPEKIKMISIRKLGDDADKVSIGDTIKIDNKIATIRFIGSGRVQVDYNHRHAGKTILFDVEILRQLDTPKSKIEEIIKYRFNTDHNQIPFTLHNNTLHIEIPNDISRLDNIQMLKHFVHFDIFNFVPELSTVTFIETYYNEKQPPETPLDSDMFRAPTTEGKPHDFDDEDNAEDEDEDGDDDYEDEDGDDDYEDEDGDDDYEDEDGDDDYEDEDGDDDYEDEDGDEDGDNEDEDDDDKQASNGNYHTTQEK